MRLRTFGRYGLQQIQVDTHYLQLYLWRFVSDEKWVLSVVVGCTGLVCLFVCFVSLFFVLCWLVCLIIVVLCLVWLVFFLGERGFGLFFALLQHRSIH